ncbi:hypothetical protein [Halosimplex marinum]|uniref:hypothetical protein n=1 Tax=Halosimplex marinum TaxID=3396620 RepID=UPI003F56F563
MSGTNYKCTGGDCGGRLKSTENPQVYECVKCGRQIRESVAERREAFERVADRDGALAEIARAALEGS